MHIGSKHMNETIKHWCIIQYLNYLITIIFILFFLNSLLLKTTESNMGHYNPFYVGFHVMCILGLTSSYIFQAWEQNFKMTWYLHVP